MRQQGDSPKRQEDDWWRQLYDEGAGGAGGAEGPAPDSIDEHFDTALSAMTPPPPASPPADTFRLRRPVPPPPPPSWPRPTRTPAPEADEPPPPVPPGQGGGPGAPGAPAGLVDAGGVVPPVVPTSGGVAVPGAPAGSATSGGGAPAGGAPRVPVVPLPGRAEPVAPAPGAAPGEGGPVPPEAPVPGAPGGPGAADDVAPPSAGYAGEPRECGGAPEEVQEGRGAEAPPWDAWAARPMFPSPGEEDAAGAQAEPDTQRRWPVWSPRPGTAEGRPVQPRPEPEPEPDEAPAAPEWGAAPPAPAEPWASAPPAGWPVPRFPEQQERPPAPGPDATFSPAEPWSSPAPAERGPYAPPRPPRVAPEENPYRTPPATDAPPPEPGPPAGTTPVPQAAPPVAPAPQPAPEPEPAVSAPPPAPEPSAPPAAGTSGPYRPPSDASGAPQSSAPAVDPAGPPAPPAAPEPGAPPAAGTPRPYRPPSGAPQPYAPAVDPAGPTAPSAAREPSAPPAEPRRSQVGGAPQPSAPEADPGGHAAQVADPRAVPVPRPGEPYRSLADAFASPGRVVPPGAAEPGPAAPVEGADPAGAPALRPAAAGGVSPGPAPAAIEAPAVRAELPVAGGGAWGDTAYAEGGVRWAPELPPGWVAAGEEEPAATVVGGGPPTYAAEPTAWPEADPEGLDGLVPDTVLDGAQYAGLTLRTVSLRGDSARYRGQPRRDALLTARFGAGDDALLLVAMASGARAADDAHRAAQDAVRWIAAAVGRSRERLAGDLRAARRGALKSGLHRLTDRCYGRLRARGEDLGLEDGAYTAALRCLLLPVDPRCPIRLFFGVGDGGLFRVRDGAWQDLDVAPEDAGSPFRFRATSAQPGDALVMCSAGLAEPLRGEPELAALLAERWGGGHAPGLAGYLADVQTRVKGYADDRTAVTVWDA